MEEKRRFSRVGCDEIIIAEIGGNSVVARLQDISLKGALVRFADGVVANPGDLCLITLRLRDSEILLKFRTEVVYKRNNVTGVKFIHIDIDTLIHLRSLMEARTADPQQVSGELQFLVED